MCHNLSLNSSQNIKFLPKLSAQFSHLAFIFVFFVAKLFSFRHKGTKTLRTNNKIKSFVLPAIGFALGEAGGSLCLGGKYFLVPR